MALGRAKEIALQIKAKLEPHCDLIHIAGSIRRQKIEVKDIEIVCLPKKIETGGQDLFGGSDAKESVHPEFVKVVNDLGKILKGKADGRMMKIQLPQKIDLDLFLPQKNDYYRQYAIRTGSREYSQHVIAAGWLQKGWCGTEDGLRLIKECNPIQQKAGVDDNGNPKYKTKWILKPDIKDPTLPPVWKNEKDFFDFIGKQYLAPESRNFIL